MIGDWLVTCRLVCLGRDASAALPSGQSLILVSSTNQLAQRSRFTRSHRTPFPGRKRPDAKQSGTELSTMTETKTSAHHPTTELVRTHSERLAFEERERAQKRRLELAEQRSDLNPPDVRIRTWEQVHALRLPDDPMHPVLDVIAIDTRLTLAQVQEEQRARVAQRSKRTQAREPDGNR